MTEPFLCRLVPQLVEEMGEAYPELASQQKLIISVIKEEELAFLRTLDHGIRLIDDYMAKNPDKKSMSGKSAFLLYDTYGFPIDLTQLIAAEYGFTVDLEGFKVELEKQKERARNATANEFGDWIVYHEGEGVEFTGYDETVTYGARLLKQRTVVQKNKEMIQLVFDRTPFYGEMGGEVGDTGSIMAGNGEKVSILNTVKENNLTIHIADKLPTDCSGLFTLIVNAPRRLKIANNHSCTHLLHRALREILGRHVEQKGSFVTDNYFRFDFSHFEKLSPEQTAKVEARVNAFIRANSPLEENRHATMEEAQKMGAMALFGEKYGDEVRVVKFADSVELCGGCHTSATGNIGVFKIVSESAIAAGVRRIEAVTGEEALNRMNGFESAVQEAKELLGNAQDLSAGIRKLLAENATYKKMADELVKERTLALKRSILEKVRDKNGMRFVLVQGSADAAMLRNALLMLQKEESNLAVAAAVESEGRPQLLVMYSADLVAGGKDAVALVKSAARFIQGGGGGQAGLATAGGKNAQGLQDALNLFAEQI